MNSVIDFPVQTFSRRRFLQLGARVAGALALLPWLPGSAWAASLEAIFKEKAVDAVLKGLGGDVQPSDQVTIVTPDIAENGAVVPIGVTSSIPKTESIAILIEKNPNMLTAVFDIPAGTEPSVSTRIKMGQSSNVYALVKADGKYYLASKEIKVTLGGCGG